MARTESSNITQALEDGTFFVEDEIPTGTIDGSNTSFTLTYTPNPASSLKVWIRPSRLTLTEDYSLSGDDLTFVKAPRDGMVPRVSYRVEPT